MGMQGQELSISKHWKAWLTSFFTSKGHPILVIFNYGTTFKGAYDDIKAAGEALLPVLQKNGMYERTLHLKDATIIRRGFWFHIDGALGAAYAPFLQMAYKNGLTDNEPPPIFDFQLDFVSSIVTSGHKWIGVPCGIYITKMGLQLRPIDKGIVTYTESPDTTLSGSRNAHSALVLWAYISTNDYQKQANKAMTEQDTVLYATRRLKDVEAEVQQDLWVIHSPASLAVCFKKPNKSIMEKYSLTRSWLRFKGEWRQYAHFFVMDGVTRSRVDEIVDDLWMPGAFE